MTSFPPGPSSSDGESGDRDSGGPGGSAGGPGATPPSEPYGSAPPPNPYGSAPPPAPYAQPAPYGAPSGYGQPAAYGQVGVPVGVPPANNLVWGILTTLFCCLPLGIVSIVFAAQVNDKWARGDAGGAYESAEKAKKFAIWSAVAAAAVLVLVVVFFVLVFAGIVGSASLSTT